MPPGYNPYNPFFNATGKFSLFFLFCIIREYCRCGTAISNGWSTSVSTTR